VYICDKHFHTDEFLELFQPRNGKRHGLIWSSGDTADFYELADQGKSAPVKLKTIHTLRQKGQKKGGQSAARFGRIHDNQVASLAKLVAETANALFLEDGRPSISSLTFGGTGGDKVGIYALASRSNHLNKDLQTISTGSHASEHISHLIKVSELARDKLSSVGSDRIVAEFLDHIRRDSGFAVYGVNDLIANAKMLKTIVYFESSKHLWTDLLSKLGPKTQIVASNSGTVSLYGGLVAISFFPVAL